MKPAPYRMLFIIIICLMGAPLVNAAEIAGVWRKTTHPDPGNTILIYQQSQDIKAIGYEIVGDRPAHWHGEGRFRDGNLELRYHYSADATPFGWEPDGRMTLTLSEDGNTLRGMAIADSGGWSDRIELIRVTDGALSRR